MEYSFIKFLSYEQNSKNSRKIQVKNKNNSDKTEQKRYINIKKAKEKSIFSKK